MIKIKRDNLNDLALAHYKSVVEQRPGKRDWPLSKLLKRLQKEYADTSDEYKMIAELLVKIVMVKDDPETSIITCKPKKLEEQYKYFLNKYPALHIDTVFKTALKTAFFYGDYDKWGAYNLADKLAVNTCPYCNRQSTFTLGTDESHGTRPQFDHYINRAAAPYFSLSFYNLVPSCYICNSNLKHDTFFSLDDYIHPYHDDLTEDVVFTIGVKEIEFIDGKAEAYNLVFKRSDKTTKPESETDRALKTYADFKLTDLYSKHKDFIDELIQKSRTYTTDYIDSLYNTYKGTLFDKKEEVYKMLLSNYFLIDELEKRPLAKLTRDISKELEFLSEGVLASFGI